MGGESVWDHPCDEYHRSLYQKERAKKYGLPYDAPDVPDPNAPGITGAAKSSGDGPGEDKSPAGGRSVCSDSADASSTLEDSMTSALSESLGAGAEDDKRRGDKK